MLPDYRIIRTPHGPLRARVINPDSFGLGTQLDAFFMERKTEPTHYSPMGKVHSNPAANPRTSRAGNRGRVPMIAVV